MLGATLASLRCRPANISAPATIREKLGSAHPRNAPYQAFRAKDGHFVMAAGNDRLWSSVCQVVARPDLVKDARFLDTASRTRNQVELCALLEAIFADRDAADWIGLFTAAGVPCGPINTYSQILRDPQVAHMGWVRDMTLPTGLATKTFTCPVRLSGKNIEVRSPPPQLGQHRDEVVAWLRASGMADLIEVE